MQDCHDHADKVDRVNDWSTLPRSVQWRLKLGILSEPPLTREGQEDNSSKRGSSSSSNHLTLEILLKQNQLIVTEINDKFKDLVTKHVEEDEQTQNERNESNHNDAASNGGVGGNAGNNNHDTDTAATASVPAEIDPLTAMVMEEQARETRKAELYLKYRKERARRKRGLTTEARIIESESDEVDRASVSHSVLRYWYNDDCDGV